MNNGRFLVIDTETRCLQDVNVGPNRYFEDPSSEMLCLRYAVGMESDIRLWHCATEGYEESPFPEELFDLIEQGYLIEAHNVMFERAGFLMMGRRRGWPELPVDQLRCSAAKAAYHGLPRALEPLAVMLRTKNQKDPRGKGYIKLLSSPQKVLKKDLPFIEAQGLNRLLGEPHRLIEYNGKLCYWNEDPETIRNNWEYCAQDVRTERECSLALPEMPDHELEIWRTNQEMNLRGVRINQHQARTAIGIASVEVAELNETLNDIVGVKKATQRAKILAWLQERFPELPNTQAETLEKFGDRSDVPEEVHTVIDIMRKVNKSSLAKYASMLDRVCADGHIRDNLMYCGAHTHREAGVGVQVQNFPKGKIKHMDTAIATILEGQRDWIMFLYGDVMELLSHALRGAIVADEDELLFVADYAAIEARVLLWLADAKEALNVFRTGGDIYCDMATKLYGYVTNKADHPVERGFGKCAVLGLGFQMAFVKFMLTMRKAPYNIHFSEEQVRAMMPPEAYARWARWLADTSRKGGAMYVKKAKTQGLDVDLERDFHELVLTKFVVTTYREGYPEVPRMWKDQENAAVKAVRSPGTTFTAGKVKWQLKGRRLRCLLPSGSCLTYWDPVVAPRRLTEDEEQEIYEEWLQTHDFDEVGAEAAVEVAQKRMRSQLSYRGIDEKTHQERRIYLYGGKIVENCLAGDTETLTDRGWVPLQEVQDMDRVWDGVEWVAHGGLVAQGLQETGILWGVEMTSDHKVLTTEGWRCASQSAGFNRAEVRFPGGNSLCRVRREEISLESALRLRDGEGGSRSRAYKETRSGPQELRLPLGRDDRREESNSWYDNSPGLCGMEVDAGALLQSESRGFQKLWGARNPGLQGVAPQLRPILGGYGSELSERPDHRKARQLCGLLSGELSMGHFEGAESESKDESVHRYPTRANAVNRGRRAEWTRGHDINIPHGEWLSDQSSFRSTGLWTQVFDLVNAGPRQRFTVRGREGQVFIVHNCVQSVARDFMEWAKVRIRKHGMFKLLLSIHDEIVAALKKGPKAEMLVALELFIALISELPPWGEGCPIDAEGWFGPEYKKG